MSDDLDKKANSPHPVVMKFMTVKCGCDELACFYKNFYILLNIILVQV